MSTGAVTVDGVRYLGVVPIDPVSGGASSKSSALRVATDLARPANVTPYTALDVVGSTLTFADFGETEQNYMITSASIRFDVAAVPAGMVGFRLHLFNAAPASAGADNAAFNLAAADRDKYMGYVDISPPSDLGDTIYSQDTNIGKQVTLASSSLFGVLQTLGAYTPAANSENYRVGLTRIEV